MSPKYLDELALPPDLRSKIEGFAATTPAALLSMIYAAPSEFQAYIGEGATSALKLKLEAMVSPEELRRLRRAQPSFGGSLGARLERPPGHPSRPKRDELYARRDDLLDRIDQLQRLPRRSELDNARLDRARADLDGVLTELFSDP
jgi:hypothetical protein